MTEDELPHALAVVLRDELGVVVTCSCNRWGYAGPDEQKARAEHARHIDEFTGNDGKP